MLIFSKSKNITIFLAEIMNHHLFEIKLHKLFFNTIRHIIKCKCYDKNELHVSDY